MADGRCGAMWDGIRCVRNFAHSGMCRVLLPDKIIVFDKMTGKMNEEPRCYWQGEGGHHVLSHVDEATVADVTFVIDDKLGNALQAAGSAAGVMGKAFAAAGQQVEKTLADVLFETAKEKVATPALPLVKVGEPLPGSPGAIVTSVSVEDSGHGVTVQRIVAEDQTGAVIEAKATVENGKFGPLMQESVSLPSPSPLDVGIKIHHQKELAAGGAVVLPTVGGIPKGHVGSMVAVDPAAAGPAFTTGSPQKHYGSEEFLPVMGDDVVAPDADVHPFPCTRLYVRESDYFVLARRHDDSGQELRYAIVNWQGRIVRLTPKPPNFACHVFAHKCSWATRQPKFISPVQAIPPTQVPGPADPEPADKPRPLKKGRMFSKEKE